MIEGRITKGVGGLYTVSSASGRYECNVRGIFRKKNIKPTIGDFVTVDEICEKTQTGTIVAIEERRNSLVRPRVANIDQVILVFSIVNPALNLDLLDRFLITVEHRKIEPLICLSKIDLLRSLNSEQSNQEGEFHRICRLYEKIGYRIIGVSVVTGEGIESLKSTFSGKVSAFAGPSGVGKSSIINKIIPKANMETGELSLKIQRGKHTTRHAELLEAYENSFIVDSPGFTTLNMDEFTDENLASLFKEFRPFLSQCRFNDCRHLREPDCMVKQQVGTLIDPVRYERYKSFVKG